MIPSVKNDYRRTKLLLFCTFFYIIYKKYYLDSLFSKNGKKKLVFFEKNDIIIKRSHYIGVSPSGKATDSDSVIAKVRILSPQPF